MTTFPRFLPALSELCYAAVQDLLDQAYFHTLKLPPEADNERMVTTESMYSVDVPTLVLVIGGTFAVVAACIGLAVNRGRPAQAPVQQDDEKSPEEHRDHDHCQGGVGNIEVELE